MKTTYKVMSKNGYAGHAEGEEFEAELTEDQERRAKERGAIRVVKRGDNAKEKEAASDG